jgi:hypothetical protein
MRVPRFDYGSLLACVLLVVGMVAAGTVCVQSDAELKALNQRVIELHRARKYHEAIPIAEELVTATRKRDGEEHPNYAASIRWLAQLFQDTDRFGEAEPLYRRALDCGERLGTRASRRRARSQQSGAAAQDYEPVV